MIRYTGCCVGGRGGGGWGMLLRCLVGAFLFVMVVV